MSGQQLCEQISLICAGCVGQGHEGSPGMPRGRAEGEGAAAKTPEQGQSEQRQP